MPAHHMVVRLISLGEREFFYHALDFMKFSKVDRFFAIECLAGRPAMNRGAFLDEDCSVDLSFTSCGNGQLWI